MENPAPKYGNAVVSLGICALAAGILVFGTGCPVEPTACTTDADCPAGQVCNTTTGVCEAAPTVCTSDADCEAGEVCNTDTGECEPAPTGCTSDADCEADEFCDTGTGECVTNENLYEVTRVDADYEPRVHFEPSGHANCTVCHHAADDAAGVPNAAGLGCLACHSDDPNQPGSFKEVAHDQNESGDGCRMCHAAEWTDNCAYCHAALGNP